MAPFGPKLQSNTRLERASPSEIEARKLLSEVWAEAQALCITRAPRRELESRRRTSRTLRRRARFAARSCSSSGLSSLARGAEAVLGDMPERRTILRISGERLLISKPALFPLGVAFCLGVAGDGSGAGA